MQEYAHPLEGVLVLDFSQFLAGPVAAMRLGDLGARVIKVERPAGGDIGRQLAFAGRDADADTVSFHAMNRNKEGVAADLKNPGDLAFVKELVARADVLVENFRPGVMERIGLDYETVRAINPRIVYGSVTGYGEEGPWRQRPGQDLLAQSISGLPWLNGSADDPPVPVGLAVADHLASCHLAQGITALLFRRERTGIGGRTQTSLLESMIDLQFELIGVHLFDPSVTVRRAGRNSAHPFLPAPYGIFPTADGYLALAMNPIPTIGAVLGIDALRGMADEREWWADRARIEQLLSAHLSGAPTQHWLDLLDREDVWCAPVLTLEELVAHDGFATLGMTQTVQRDAADDADAVQLELVASPLRFDSRRARFPRPAPRLGEHTDAVRAEFASGPALSADGGARE